MPVLREEKREGQLRRWFRLLLSSHVCELEVHLYARNDHIVIAVDYPDLDDGSYPMKSSNQSSAIIRFSLKHSPTGAVSAEAVQLLLVAVQSLFCETTLLLMRIFRT